MTGAPGVGNPTVNRHLLPILNTYLEDEPVVVINGARTVGKSTLLEQLARHHKRPVFDLDDQATRVLAERDPQILIQAEPPVLIDEFQHVPDLLRRIKTVLNRGADPGRFVLTGSTRYLTTPTLAESLAGRVAIVDMWPLSQGELGNVRETFLDTLFSDARSMVTSTLSETSRIEYRNRVLTGGYPLGLARKSQKSRERWYRNYLDTVTQRDVLEISQIRQRELLPLILRRLAAQTAQVMNYSSVARSLQLDDTVVRDYTSLLDIVFLVHRLDSWGRTLIRRSSTSPKVHVVDSGLAGWLLGITGERIDSLDPTVLTEYGHLVETFAVNELMKQAGWSETAVRFGHYRTHDGHEVDLVLETDDGRVAAIEVKAGSAVSGKDLTGLRRLRELVGSRFVAGVALYTGSRSYTYEDRLHVLPLDTLWCSPGSAELGFLDSGV
jgi:predicted AAA+ superfamily ATPase